MFGRIDTIVVYGMPTLFSRMSAILVIVTVDVADRFEVDSAICVIVAEKGDAGKGYQVIVGSGSVTMEVSVVVRVFVIADGTEAAMIEVDMVSVSVTGVA